MEEYGMLCFGPLLAAEWEYLGEGNAHLVCRYKKHWANCLHLAIIFILLGQSSGYSLTGCNRVSVTFKRNNWLGLRSSEVVALKEVTAQFADGITSFIGSSGSGKSTLGKLILDCDAVNEEMFTRTNGAECGYSSQYIDPLYYMSYDNSKSCGELLNPSAFPSITYTQRSDNAVLEAVAAQSGLPLHSKVASLLESERRIFEITRALMQRRGVGPPILVLDEYLDKDSSSVTKKVAKFLRYLCTDPAIRLQVIIITHSESVMNEVSDWVVVLNNGCLFHQGQAQKIRRPAQLQMLQ